MINKWSYIEEQHCSSTFILARQHPAWTAVNSICQSAGRGRFNRSWIGEEGGLWVSYNVPIDESLPLPWGQMPLLAGVALMRALAPYKIEGLRLRWPNDIMVGHDKLAGILVERPNASVVSIGIGVNISNDTVRLYGKMSNHPTRLSAHITPCPSVHEFRHLLAEAISSCYEEFSQGGMSALAGELEAAWDGERPIVAICDDARHCGFFAGVDENGSPKLRLADGRFKIVNGIEVNRLKELI